MPEDLSPGEVARTIHRIERTLDGLDSKVDRLVEQVLTVNHDTAQNAKDIGRLESARKSESAKHENRRWMIYLALVAAGLAFLSQFYFAARGG